ncbi:MAG: mandelate racemase/muconate lactonizing enzyme family protein, partial [Victivallales bacterium]
MKITKIEPIVVGAPTPGCGLLSNRNYIFVKVHTDEGITGLGEATLEGYDNSIKGLLKDLEKLLIGEDPTRIEYLTQVMIRQKFWKGGILKGTAVAGIELALWDILGKSVGLPVYKLVGGACRDKIRVYANGWSGGATDPAQIKEKAHEALATGYRAFKFSLAVAGWPLNDRQLIKKIVNAAEVIREAVGMDCPLMFDGHGRYDADLAIQIGQALKDVDLYFFEEPVQPEDVDAMVKVAQNVPMPLATGERLSLKNEFRNFLDKKAVAILQPDLAHCHGFGEGLKIAHLADAFSAWVAPHCPMSPVITAISLHLDAA